MRDFKRRWPGILKLESSPGLEVGVGEDVSRANQSWPTKLPASWACYLLRDFTPATLSFEPINPIFVSTTSLVVLIDSYRCWDVFHLTMRASLLSFCRSIYSLWSITINPMIPRRTVLSQGCSLSIIVTYPTICEFLAHCKKRARGHRTYRNVSSHAAHNVLLTVEVVLALSIQLRIIGKIVVSLEQRIIVLVHAFEKAQGSAVNVPWSGACASWESSF